MTHEGADVYQTHVEVIGGFLDLEQNGNYAEGWRAMCLPADLCVRCKTSLSIALVSSAKFKTELLWEC